LNVNAVGPGQHHDVVPVDLHRLRQFGLAFVDDVILQRDFRRAVPELSRPEKTQKAVAA
jgi:hypothetical protein